MNWKDYVIEKDPKNHPDTYSCRFCDHMFTYTLRNGPRTILKHLERHHPSARLSGPMGTDLAGLGHVTDLSATAIDLDAVVKVASKQWRTHFDTNEGKTLNMPESKINQRYMNLMMDCKYCDKSFLYCLRNGPGTLVRHLETCHIPEILQRNPSIARNLEAFQQLQNIEGGAEGVFESRCLKNLSYLNRAARRWRLHYRRAEAKANDLVEMSYPEERGLKFNPEVYVCIYCGAPKVYVSRNGPKTLIKHLEKEHKKELLGTAPEDLETTRKRQRNREKEVQEATVAAAAALAGKNIDSEFLTMAISESIKRQKTGNHYTREQLREDLDKLEKEFTGITKSDVFRDIIGGLREDYLSVLYGELDPIGSLEFDNIDSMTSNIEKTISEHGLLRER